MSKFADIIIDISHEQLDKTFQYIIPEELKGEVTIGSEVVIPFGKSNRRIKGYVIDFSSQPALEMDKMKSIESLSGRSVAIEGQLIQLAAWIKENCGSTMIQALKTVLPVKKQVRERKKKDEEPEAISPGPEIVLNEEQLSVVENIVNDVDDPEAYLIHGITGSGKTEVYMEIIDRTVKEGRQAIMLIPEIALTYQMVLRFRQRFGDRVSIMNSRLSQGERYRGFESARKGDIDIMIGPRSALFTPFKSLGVVIIDEEHESSYKSETVPRYHARDVAVARAKMCGAKVILGSATPSVDSFYKASIGDYKLFTLERRATGGSLAETHVVDMRQELQRGNKSIISGLLRELMEDRLEKKEQIMLFINRRGYESFVSCRSCGKAVKCPHCDVALTQHGRSKLVCHYCGYTEVFDRKCKVCGSPYVAGFKAGTEKVEEIVRDMFPQAGILRMDADTTGKKDGHARILSAFSGHKADILIGTQMIVKGHDYANVTLVGVLAADLSLYSSNFLSSERTFQLLTQAAGRSGRGRLPGDVVIQTYSPDNYAILAAADQDYDSFYEKEIGYRRLLRYPPVYSMLLILISSPDEEDVEQAALAIAGQIPEEPDILVTGPAAGPVSKVKDMHKRVIYIKASDRERLKNIKDNLEIFIKNEISSKNTGVIFDFNPLGFM
ncbi:MAG: primosomal protein N' [Lachnospiraceae bacterium]|nr:primosomal protein N' [Lachnospiraceae bacterium]